MQYLAAAANRQQGNPDEIFLQYIFTLPRLKRSLKQAGSMVTPDMQQAVLRSAVVAGVNSDLFDVKQTVN